MKLEDSELRFLEIEEQFKKYQIQIANAKKLAQDLERALEVARDQITQYEDIVIPGLVASHDVFVKRWEAESSVHSMRAALPPPATERSEY